MLNPQMTDKHQELALRRATAADVDLLTLFNQQLIVDREWTGRLVKLDVLLRNERALGFYRSLGFADHSLVLRRRQTRTRSGQ